MTFGDADIRRALRSQLVREHADAADTVIVDELGLCRGQVRVDIAVVNGRFHGYEIKSDRDSLRRLAGQVATYGRVLDQATVVVGDRHLSNAAATVPSWWGVLRVAAGDGAPRFETVRPARKNPHRETRSLVELLWLDDALALLNRRVAIRGLRGKPRSVVWDRVCETFDADEVAAAVRERLKARVGH